MTSIYLMMLRMCRYRNEKYQHCVSCACIYSLNRIIVLLAVHALQEQLQFKLHSLVREQDPSSWMAYDALAMKIVL